MDEGCAARAGGRVYGDSSWFIDNDQVIIFVADIQVHGDGGEVVDSGCLKFGKDNGLIGNNFVSWFGDGFPIDRDSAFFDMSGEFGSAHFRNHPGEELIESLLLIGPELHRQ